MRGVSGVEASLGMQDAQVPGVCGLERRAGCQLRTARLRHAETSRRMLLERNLDDDVLQA
jgi:hypothetical protein